ncbi:MAG: hypothetical protein Ta2F_03520 [Termitinemataceae bacterium]|nr:MAG: hypothetical protein Ta2F_03520 [Termitinemataceae bacterium]
MTLSKHVLFLKTGIILTAVVVSAFTFISWRILPFYPELCEKAAFKSSVFFLSFKTYPYISYITALLSLVYTLVFQVMILYFFEKTQSVEVRFLNAFVFSLAFESARMVLPIMQLMTLPLFYFAIAGRVLLFGRFFGAFSIFAASLCVGGFKNKKEEQIFLTIAIVALLFSLQIPIDVLSWSTSLVPRSGFHVMLDVIEFCIVIISFVNFFMGSITRKTREYFYAGCGIFTAYMGSKLLVSADLIIPAIFGFLLLCAGTWFSGIQFRRMYLWQ